MEFKEALNNCLNSYTEDSGQVNAILCVALAIEQLALAIEKIAEALQPEVFEKELKELYEEMEDDEK